MSAASLLSMKEKPSDSNTESYSHEGHDEELSVMGAGGDPAVLALGPARRALVYSVRELVRLRDSPLVRKDLDTAFVGNERLVLVLKRRTESPNEEDRGARGDAPNENQNHKGVYGRERDRERRSADPRERVRKESETSGGIVLSPQRRSFTSGCGAPGAPAAAPPHVARTRPESPLAAVTAKPDPGGRRIGSGRIMVRDTGATWEEPEWTGAEPYRPPRERGERDSRTNGDRYERRSYGRDSYTSEMKRERDDRFNNEKNRDSRDNRDNRDNRDGRDNRESRDNREGRDNRDRDDYRRSGGRNRRYDKDEEPEWFSGGPTSQHDTIELRGFDEPNTKPTKDTKDQEKWNGGSKSPERWRSEPADATSPQTTPSDNNTSNETESTAEVQPEEPATGAAGSAGGAGGEEEFNLDDFLKMDSIPDVLTNGNAESEGGGSRFSRWFRRESPTAAHFEPLLQSIVDDLDCTRLEPASEPHHVFAPISPAPAPSLLDLLRRANANADAPPGRESNNMSGGKIHSLEELEARLRPQPQPPTPDQDMSAFKRLLAQVSGGHAVPGAHQPQAPPPQQPQQPQPMSLLQMLSKSMEAQQKQSAQPVPAPAQQQPPHIPQQLLYKLLQVQQRQQQQQQQQAQQAQAQQQARPPMGPTAADRELLQRPEAQAIIHGLKAGEITVQHLMQQLGNPGLQSRHREVLLTILRLHQQQRQMGAGSPLPPSHLVVPPHHQQPLTLSPLPHPAYCVSPIMATSPNTLTVHHTGVPNRIPSPRELVAHTQCIMQSALIKKKLEEQRENYRRRHELPKQPTPISFTPTSVLRKMTAEKEAESLSPKQQWAQPPKMPQGRPIVKGNQAGAPPMGYGPQSDYQQYLAQQQMTSGRPFTQPPRQQVQYANMARGMASGTTLHQLLVQSHQRSLNEMGGGAAGGGDNQLARWFSPELLARASAGKLPSVHVPNAMSLEELERHHSPAPAPTVRN